MGLPFGLEQLIRVDSCGMTSVVGEVLGLVGTCASVGGWNMLVWVVPCLPPHWVMMLMLAASGVKIELFRSFVQRSVF